ncbi:MAG: electron transport complex subunit RsxC [Clostridiales bacterium]|nr:electron transport complex subunit RsxC [Clostridiales bacterium]
MANTFRGGAHPDAQKNATSHKPIEELKAAGIVVLPVSMHTGATCDPIVKLGDIVDLGQKIADSSAFISAPVHATVSGKIIAIEPRLHPNGLKTTTIVIQNDYEDRLHPSIKPRDYEHLTGDELIGIIREAGIVGHGGAAFPTHVKIKSGIGKVNSLIINAAECEPYITSDHRILLEHADEVVGGITILMKIFGLNEATIGIETNKQDAIPVLKEAIGGRQDIKIFPLKPKYPQGAEKQLISVITGREVPSGALPADVGAAVFNVDTCGAVYRAVSQGIPMMRRVVTVSGSAIANPKNLDVRIGTPLEKLIEATGGFKEEPNKVLMGGPMMGVAQFSLEVPVIKGTNAILAFSDEEGKHIRSTSCIRCGKCVNACPMNLVPTYLYLYSENEKLEECERYGVLDCIECGACNYECPARLYLVQSFRMAKQRILEARRK